MQEHLLAKRIVICSQTGSEESLQSVHATGSALFVSGAVAPGRSTTLSEGEVCEMSCFIISARLSLIAACLGVI